MGLLSPRDFKSLASANFATPATGPRSGGTVASGPRSVKAAPVGTQSLYQALCATGPITERVDPATPLLSAVSDRPSGRLYG